MKHGQYSRTKQSKYKVQRNACCRGKAYRDFVVSSKAGVLLAPAQHTLGDGAEAHRY